MSDYAAAIETAERVKKSSIATWAESELAAAVLAMTGEIEVLTNEAENCRQQAIDQAQESRTQAAIVRGCYTAAGIVGKGDWNGAEPVRQRIVLLEAACERALNFVENIEGEHGMLLETGDLLRNVLILPPDESRGTKEKT